MRERFTTRQKSIKEVCVTTVEVLSNGQEIPVYEPVQHSKRIRNRKYKEALSKYSKNLRSLLEKGYKLKSVEDITVGTQASDEEKLIRYTHRLFVMVKDDDVSDIVKCAVPCNNRTLCKYSKNIGGNIFQHRYVCDENGIAIVSFRSEIKEKEIRNFQFVITFIDLYTLYETYQENVIEMKEKENITFDLIICRGILCAVWVDHNICSTWHFNNEIDKKTIFFQFKINENLKEAYHFNMDHDYLVVITKDDDFFDSVFSSDNSAQRMTSYYKCATGQSFNSKNVIGQILKQDELQHASDILFLNIPSNPKWMILEWMLPNMTLSHVIIYKQHPDGTLEKDGVFNFQSDFSEYETYFGKLNELQCKVFISRSPWRAFLWISWNDVIIIDLCSYEIIGILRTDLSKYKDFKNELYEFKLDVTRTAQRVTLFVTRNMEIVHFCRFNLVPSLSLKLLALKNVIEQYSAKEINGIHLTDSLKAEVLDAY